MFMPGDALHLCTDWHPCPGCSGKVAFVDQPALGAMHHPNPPCDWFARTDVVEIARTVRLLLESTN